MNKPKFKIGDVVVYSRYSVFEIFKITSIKIQNDNFYSKTVDKEIEVKNIFYNGVINITSYKSQHLRLATPEEIKLYCK